MKDLEGRKEPVALNPENAFEDDIKRGLKSLIDDRSMFYHIEVRADILSIRKEGYNTPPLEFVEYDMSQLIETEGLNQKTDAIREVYTFVFGETGDLKSRVSTLNSRMFADSHDGASHAFYHDRTGKYPESEIVEPLKEELLKSQSR